MPTIKNEGVEDIYYITKNSNGNIIHASKLKPGQELTTTNTIEQYTNEIDQIEEIESQLGSQPSFSQKFDNSTKTWAEFKIRTSLNNLYLLIPESIADQLNDTFQKLIKQSRSGKYNQFISSELLSGYQLFKIRKDRDTIPISASTNIANLENILSNLVAQNTDFTQQDADEVLTNVQNNLGIKAKIFDIIPTSWKQNAIDDNEAIAKGYITEYD